MARRARVTGVGGGLPVPGRTAFTVGGNGTSSNGSGEKDTLTVGPEVGPRQLQTFMAVSYRNAWANLHLLSEPNTVHADRVEPARALRQRVRRRRDPRLQQPGLAAVGEPRAIEIVHTFPSILNVLKDIYDHSGYCNAHEHVQMNSST
jgi:hypothetical protein